MKFICDEMLQGLARWLRIAGYDTLMAEPGTADRKLIETAIKENRTLLTRDRKILEIRHAKDCTRLLNGNSIEAWVCQLNSELSIDWHLKPFSRCLLCNHELETATKDAWEKMPDESRAMTSVVMHCPQCNKLYWEGSHVRRMSLGLDKWDEHCR